MDKKYSQYHAGSFAYISRPTILYRSGYALYNNNTDEHGDLLVVLCHS